jgi:hypothetical protein
MQDSVIYQNAAEQLTNDGGERMDTNFCAQCGSENQQNRVNCSDCGAALAAKSFWDINSDGKVDMNDLKTFMGNMAGSVKKTFRSKTEKDKEAIEKLSESFKAESAGQTANMQQQFKDTLKSTVDIKISERLAKKPAEKPYLDFVDAQIITTYVHNIFKKSLSFTPRQVSAACALSKAVLAPSEKDRQAMVKSAVGFAGGTAGIGMVISAVGTALGWGAGIIATMTALFVGSSFAGPIMWGVGGLSLVAVSAYFARTSSHQTDTARFIDVLQASLEKAVEAIWDEHGEKLTESMKKS